MDPNLLSLQRLVHKIGMWGVSFVYFFFIFRIGKQLPIPKDIDVALYMAFVALNIAALPFVIVRVVGKAWAAFGIIGFGALLAATAYQSYLFGQPARLSAIMTSRELGALVPFVMLTLFRAPLSYWARTFFYCSVGVMGYQFVVTLFVDPEIFAGTDVTGFNILKSETEYFRFNLFTSAYAMAYAIAHWAGARRRLYFVLFFSVLFVYLFFINMQRGILLNFVAFALILGALHLSWGRRAATLGSLLATVVFIGLVPGLEFLLRAASAKLGPLFESLSFVNSGDFNLMLGLDGSFFARIMEVEFARDLITRFPLLGVGSLNQGWLESREIYYFADDIGIVGFLSLYGLFGGALRLAPLLIGLWGGGREGRASFNADRNALWYFSVFLLLMFVWSLPYYQYPSLVTFPVAALYYDRFFGVRSPAPQPPSPGRVSPVRLVRST